MKKTWDTLYESMLEEIRQCWGKGLPALSEIESCYHIACSHWNGVRKKLSCYLFETKGDEICFFKVWKPRFLSEIIFYERFNHLEVFKPDQLESYRNFLLRERTRLKKFVWDNKEFFEYYKSGDSSKDERYFLRKPELETGQATPSPYDHDEKTCTTHDYLVAQLIALERYDHLLEKRISGLETNHE